MENFKYERGLTMSKQTNKMDLFTSKNYLHNFKRILKERYRGVADSISRTENLNPKRAVSRSI